MAVKDQQLVYREVGTAVTATANSASVRVPQGLRNVQMHVEIHYSAAANASGSNTVTFAVQESADNSTFTDHATAGKDVITLTTTAKRGKILIPISPQGDWTQVRAIIAGAGTSPTIVYHAFLVIPRI